MPAELSPRHAVYAGSFDPLTLGHLDIVTRGAALFEKLTIAIGVNPDKQPLFELEERVALIEESIRNLNNVRVVPFNSLAVTFVKECGASVLLRGIRTLTDIDAEFAMSLANNVLAPEIETVFLMAADQYSHISSTLIKQIAKLGGETCRDRLKSFVPENFIEPLLAKYREE